MNSFHQFTRSKRIAGDFTLKAVANHLGLGNRSDVFRKEKGTVRWHVNELILLADFYGIKPSELLAEWENENAG